MYREFSTYRSRVPASESEPLFHMWLAQVDLTGMPNADAASVDYNKWCARFGHRPVGRIRFLRLIRLHGPVFSVPRAESVSSVVCPEDQSTCGSLREWKDDQDSLPRWAAQTDLTQFTVWEEANASYRHYCLIGGENPQSARSVRKLWEAAKKLYG